MFFHIGEFNSLSTHISVNSTGIQSHSAALSTDICQQGSPKKLSVVKSFSRTMAAEKQLNGIRLLHSFFENLWYLQYPNRVLWLSWNVFSTICRSPSLCCFWRWDLKAWQQKWRTTLQRQQSHLTNLMLWWVWKPPKWQQPSACCTWLWIWPEFPESSPH